jgi:replicative DNA helicase
VSEINVAQPPVSDGCETVSGMGHLLGYARVSTTDQQPQLQVDALERAGCYRVFTDTATSLDGRGWAPPAPLGAAGAVPAFPVEVLPGWLGEYVSAVATATQTPPDLAGMLALAVLATVAAGAVRSNPGPGGANRCACS